MADWRDEEIPGIGPFELDPQDAQSWIKTLGSGASVKYLSAGKTRAKCEECLHLILDHHNGREFDRAPGLAREAKYKRVQGGEEHLLCAAHAARYQEREAAGHG